MTGAPNLLPIEAVMARLACSRTTVYRLARARTLIACKVGRIWKFDPRHVEQYLDQQRAAVRVVSMPTTPAQRGRLRRATASLRPGEPELKRPGADRFM